MAQITGITELNSRLRQLADQSHEQMREGVSIGYSQRYALFVHENLEARHRVGQAKYLEQPMRELKDELFNVVAGAVKGGATFVQGLLLAGFRLLRESQQLVPVDTSALKASGYVCVDSQQPSVAAAKFAESEAIRIGRKKGTR